MTPWRSMEQASGSGKIWDSRMSEEMVCRRLAIVLGASGWMEGLKSGRSGVDLFW